MCRYKSAVVLSNGDLVHSDVTDSHEHLLLLAGLTDTSRHPNFVRIEYSGADLTDIDTYALHVDQDWLPPWWVPALVDDVTRRMRALCVASIVREHRAILCGGVYAIGGLAVVDCVVSSRIVCVRDNATIRGVWGSATIQDVRDSATIRGVRGSATIQDVRDSATIQDVGGSATIEDVGDSATIRGVRGSATIQDVRDSATIQDVGGSATIQDVGGSATIQDVWDSATIERVRGSATIQDVRDSATIQDVGDSATIERVWGSATIRDDHRTKRAEVRQ